MKTKAKNKKIKSPLILSKKCSKCGAVKTIDQFYKDKNYKYGVIGRCKSCVGKYNKALYIKNKEKKNQYSKDWAIRNPERTKKNQLQWRLDHPEYCKEYNKQYRLLNSDRVKQNKKQWAKDHPESTKKAYKRWYLSHKEQKKVSDKKWRTENKDVYSAMVSKYRKKKYKTDINFRLASVLRHRINDAIKKSTKGCRKKEHMKELIGCTIDEFKKHLESQFQKGMSWDNYGNNGWHIDHIIPCDFFDLSEYAERKFCFHFTNCQPLWDTDNFHKSNKVSFAAIKEL
jgi:hypothetical protein